MPVEVRTDKIKDKHGACLEVEEYISNEGEERVQISTAGFENEYEIVDLSKNDWFEFLKEQLGGTDDENK